MKNNTELMVKHPMQHIPVKSGLKSGVPQGTILGPVMFLGYINDINESITFLIRLFADDCVIYKPITTPQDAEQLQK